MAKKKEMSFDEKLDKKLKRVAELNEASKKSNAKKDCEKPCEKRCEDCNGELSDCGLMTEDGPSIDCRYCILNDKKKLLEKENEELKAKINDYELLAQVAAECTMDLDANLSDAHKEYMDGDIPNGAYQYVLSRHANLYAMLHKCGFTEKHPIFEFPCRPKVS